jgi:integrase
MKPVEYAVAVDRYLAQARLGAESARVYRVSLATWAWPLVARRPPGGAARRGAPPPVVPLDLLDHADVPARLATSFAERAATAGPRTANRELSALRAAVTWWRGQGWITADPTVGLRPVTLPGRSGPGPGPGEVARLFLLPVGAREQVCWRLLYESGAPVARVLALDLRDLDVAARRSRTGLTWGERTAQVLPALLAGRGTDGPLLLTERRAPGSTPAADRCPITGRGRLSYRRAAELFRAANGHGWTLHDLVRAGRAARAAGPGDGAAPHAGRGAP